MRTIFVLCFLLGLLGARANEIDPLQTKADVQQFLVKRISKDYRKMNIFDRPMDGDSTSLSGKFFKWDIDGNGRTDLIINGRRVLVIMDMGDGKFQPYSLARLTESRNPVHLEALDSTDGIRKLITRSKSTLGLVGANNVEFLEKDTLIWRKGGFIEYNPAPMADFRFESIRVSTNMCYGRCPIFKMTVNADGSARYEAIQYNEEKGVFTGTVSPDQLSALNDRLSYLPLDQMAGQFAVTWTDDQTITIEIRYNGKVKNISDYGECGSLGLKRLYALFFAWRKSVEWSK